MVKSVSTSAQMPPDELLLALNVEYELMSTQDILKHAFTSDAFSRPAIVTSFGAESVVLLHIVSKIRPDTPVIFIDTGKIFGETLRYRDRLQHVLGLEDVRTVGPRQSEIDKKDPMGLLNQKSPDQCCDIRKTKVLERAMRPFNSWINGRKRFQSHTRSNLKIVERDGERLKLTPLANWTPQELKNYMLEHSLPQHPLVKQGYLSIGCFPCTSKVAATDDSRSGRWVGSSKSECGMHTKKP